MDRIQVPTDDYAAQAAELAANGSAAIVEYVYSLPLEERAKATSSVQKALFAAAKDGAGLDLYCETMRALIDRGTSGLGAVGLDEDNDKTLNSYNAMSFNLAADLADCWPNDALPREQRHFEAGLKAAEDCVRWRNELNRPPASFALAYWAKGMHLLSLGFYNGAVKSFELAQGAARRDAADNGKPTDIGAQTTFSVLLSEGYLGIAEQLNGVEGGAERYQRVIASFEEQKRLGSESADAELKEEAEFGIAQLETVRSKYVS